MEERAEIIEMTADIVSAYVGNNEVNATDLPTLIRTLAGTTGLMLTGDPILVGRDSDVDRRVRVLEQLWLHALWGGGSR